MVSEGVAGAVRAGQRWAQRRQQLVDPQCTEITSAANSYVSCFNLFINAHRRFASKMLMPCLLSILLHLHDFDSRFHELLCPPRRG